MVITSSSLPLAGHLHVLSVQVPLLCNVSADPDSLSYSITQARK